MVDLIPCERCEKLEDEMHRMDLIFDQVERLLALAQHGAGTQAWINVAKAHDLVKKYLASIS